VRCTGEVAGLTGYIACDVTSRYRGRISKLLLPYLNEAEEVL
jgi:hypothetical protein